MDYTPEQVEAREWAQRNGFQVFDDWPNDGDLAVKMESNKYAIVDQYGNVTLRQERNLGGEGGFIEFTDKQMRVTDDRGRTSIVSPHKYPIQDW